MKKKIIFVFLIFCLLNFSSTKSQEKFKNKLLVGVASVKITPEIKETFTDLNNNSIFDGDLNNPLGDFKKGKEPFKDVNGNKYFDGIWIAGFGTGRAAQGVLNNLSARCIFISYGKKQLAFVVLDLVGFLKNRIEIAKLLLKQKGFNPDNIIISSTHTHQGPDTIGLWGPKIGISGLNKKYLDFVDNKIVEVVEKASKNLKEAKVKFAKIAVRNLSPYYNGKNWGGKNPKDEVLGLIYDARDPEIVDDELLGAQFVDPKNKTIVTLVEWSGHPEVLGGENPKISADYVYYVRSKVEKNLGGICVFFSGDVGGMMSSLNAPIPIQDKNGHPVYKKDSQGKILLDENNLPYPEFSVNNLSATRSLGFILANAISEKLNNTKKFSKVKFLKFRFVKVLLPINNKFYQLASKLGMLEMDFNSLPKNKNCPLGCIPSNLYYVAFGDAEFTTVPGELLPELAILLPTDFISSGKRPNKFFPQHNPEKQNFLGVHVDPFKIKTFPLRALMKKKYKFIIGLADNEIGYIIPENDFNPDASTLGEQGDHYEETNSLGPKTATILFKKYLQLFKKK